MNVLSEMFGPLLVTRPPVPVTCNKAGANYKSEVPHLQYSPRAAFEEWLAICDGIIACGGDALFSFEPQDEAYLDVEALVVDGDGDIRPAGSSAILGNLEEIETGRVFTANGPWVALDGATMTAVMPHMLAHRRGEFPYYQRLLDEIAEQGGYQLRVVENPHRWEGLADVAVINDEVILTYTIEGRYDAGVGPKTLRSSREGVAFAADALGIPEAARVYAELVYPHFHGDTVHFGMRPPMRPAVLVHYPGGLVPASAAALRQTLHAEVVELSAEDAVTAYAGNSRQVERGVLIPAGVSATYQREITSRGLRVVSVPLNELFGKAGGGPACATLQLPRNLRVAENSPLRYSRAGAAAKRHTERLATTVTVASEYFSKRPRG